MPVGGKPTPDANTLLAAAGEVLSRDGLEGLTVRAIAKQAKTTTMAIYSRLGGKEGVLDAVHREGFTLLMDAFERALETAPERADRRVSAICRTMRAFARQYPHHYRVMLGSPPDGWRPKADSVKRVQVAWAILRREIEGLVGPEMATADAYSVFALCHGLIELERGPLVALAPDAERVFNAAIAGKLASLSARISGGSGSAVTGDRGPDTLIPFQEDRIEFGDPSFREETPRNAPCPCGSGKRYKHCHGAAAPL